MATGHVMNNTTNDTEKPLEMAIIYIFILLASVTLNTIVLVVLSYQKDLQEYMRVLYRVLASLDLVLGIVWSSWSTIWYFFRNRQTCAVTSRLFPFLHRTLVLSVLACLCGITSNLYFLVTRPLRYYNIVTKQRFFSVLVLTQIAIVIVFCVYLPIPSVPFSSFTDVLMDRCLGREARSSRTALVNDLLAIFPVCLALVLTLGIYGKLLAIALRKNRVDARLNLKFPTGPQNHQQRNHPGRPPSNLNVSELEEQPEPKGDTGFYKRFKGFFTILVLLGSFCAVWIPYMILFLVQGNSQAWLKVVVDMVAVSSTWTQPMVYLLTNKEARALCGKFLKRRINWRLKFWI